MLIKWFIFATCLFVVGWLRCSTLLSFGGVLWFSDENWLSQVMLLFRVLAGIIELLILLVLVLEWVVLRNKRDVTHWLAYLLLFSHLCLRMALVYHDLSSVLWRVVITHLCRLCEWSSNHLAVVILISWIVTGSFVWLVSALLSHCNIVLAYFLFERCILTLICCSLAYWINFPHSNHWILTLRILWLIRVLCGNISRCDLLILLINVDPIVILLLIIICCLLFTISLLRKANHWSLSLVGVDVIRSWILLPSGWISHGASSYIVYPKLILIEWIHCWLIYRYHFSGREKHRIHIIQVHLLKLGILEFLL